MGFLRIIDLRTRKWDRDRLAHPFQRLFDAFSRAQDTFFGRFEHVITLVLIATAVVLLVRESLYIRAVYEDDAIISLSYAHSLSRGWGLRVSHYSQAVEGFSNPLWTILAAIFYLLGLDAFNASVWTGVGLGCGAVVLVGAFGPAFERRQFQLEDAAAALLLATNATFAFWLGSGMETALQAFLACLCVCLFGWARRSGNVVPLAVALGLLGITRPEGPLYAVPVALLWVRGIVAGRTRFDRSSLRAIGVYALIVGGYSIFRFVYYAELFPNTYFAKSIYDFNAIHYVSTFWDTYVILVSAAAAFGCIALAGAGAEGERTWMLVLFMAVGLVFVWKARGDWMHEWRFLAPHVPLVPAMLAAGISAARSASRSVGRHSAAKRILYLVTVAGIAVFLVTIQSQRARLDGVRGTGDVSGIRNIKVGAVVQAKAAALGMIRPLVVLTDLGGCSLGLEDSEIIDVVGLADYAIAHHAGNVQARADYLIQEGLPAYISAGWGPSEYINGIPHLLEHYQQGPEMYELKGLTSDDDPRCPGGKAAIVKMSMASLQEKVEETMATDPVTALALWRCAFAYLSSDRLPPSSWRQQVGMRSESMGDAAVAASDIERAVRYFSLTAVLSGGDAWKRRKAELFRARLFAASK